MFRKMCDLRITRKKYPLENTDVCILSLRKNLYRKISNIWLFNISTLRKKLIYFFLEKYRVCNFCGSWNRSNKKYLSYMMIINVNQVCLYVGHVSKSQPISTRNEFPILLTNSIFLHWMEKSK